MQKEDQDRLAELEVLFNTAREYVKILRRGYKEEYLIELFKIIEKAEKKEWPVNPIRILKSLEKILFRAQEIRMVQLKVSAIESPLANEAWSELNKAHSEIYELIENAMRG